MAFAKSTEAHADIISIDTSAALTLPGVVGVITGEDLIQDRSKERYLLPCRKVKPNTCSKI